MKKQHSSSAVIRLGVDVRMRDPNSLVARKAAAKKASSSAKPCRERDSSSYSFVPADAKLKVSRWPKL